MKCRKGIDQPAKAKTGGQHHECEPKHHAANMRNSAEKAEIRGRGSQHQVIGPGCQADKGRKYDEANE